MYGLIKTMKISQTHLKFSDYLEEPRVLTNPEDFLGPNWKDVINFWLYLDTLSIKEKEKMEERYWDLVQDVRVSAFNACCGAAEEVVGDEVRNAAYWANDWSVFIDATRELITQHKLLEQGKTLVALPFCLNP